MIEAEIERDEHKKNVEYLKKKRELEKKALLKNLEQVKEEGNKQ